MQLTIKSHYNPCFWTAHWNAAYFRAIRNGTAPSPRDQLVSVLNIRGNNIYTNTVENVHRETNGVLEVTKEQAKRSCQLWMPESYLDAWAQIDASPGEGYVYAVENLFTFLENSSFYQVLRSVIKKGGICHAAEKVNLAGVIVLQLLRNAELLKAIGDALVAQGRNRFDLFLALTRFLNDIQFIQQIIPDVAHGRWTFYKTDNDQFPLADSAVMVEADSKMIPLSPRLLLEVQGSDPGLATGYTFCNFVPAAKMEEFRKRTIGNTFKEIIFSNDILLQNWKDTPEFVARKLAIAGNTGGYQVRYAGETFDENWLVDLCRRLLFPIDTGRA